MAKAPRPGSTRTPKGGLELAITMDGDRHVFRPDALTALQLGQLRKEVGRTLKVLYAEMAEDPDLDTLAVFVWLAKLQRGEKATFDAVAESIGYGTEFAVDSNADGDGEQAIVPDDDEDDSPEA